MYRVWRIVRWVILVVALLYVGIVIYAFPHDYQMHIDEAAAAEIQSQKITEADIDGSQLPPPPDPTEVDATVAGIDANDNGVRDDVELAIFAEYPASSPTSTAVRAAELQYAMTQQMFLSKVSDQATWEAVAQTNSRAFYCISLTYSRDDMDQYMKVTGERTDEVFDRVFNTDARRKARDGAFEYAISYRLVDDNACDAGPLKGQ